jgi:hypothetical protein
MLKTFCLTTLALLWLASSAGSQTTEPYRMTLTSVERNVRLDNWEITNRDVNLGAEAHWSVRKYTLRGGKQEGVDVAVVDNGRLIEGRSWRGLHHHVTLCFVAYCFLILIRHRKKSQLDLARNQKVA